MTRTDRKSLVESEPPPIKNDHPAMWDLVLADVAALHESKFEDIGADEHGIQTSALAATLVDMQDRDQMGLEKYGTRLQPFNGRDGLVDTYQEFLDACVYLRLSIHEATTTTGETPADLQGLYLNTLHSTVVLRSLIWRRDGQ